MDPERINKEYAAMLLDPAACMSYSDHADNATVQENVTAGHAHVADLLYALDLDARRKRDANDHRLQLQQASATAPAALAALLPSAPVVGGGGRRQDANAADEKAKQATFRKDCREEFTRLLTEYYVLYEAGMPEEFRGITAGQLSELASAKRAVYNKARTSALQELPSVERFWTAARRREFPLFAKSLRYIVTIPASSVACEALFSHITRILGRHRHKLADGTLATLSILNYDQWSMVDFIARSMKSDFQARSSAGGSAAAVVVE